MTVCTIDRSPPPSAPRARLLQRRAFEILRPLAALTVTFAPDYRAANPYQRLLAEALRAQNVRVTFADPGEHGCPLSGARGQADLLHLHWPEAFFNPTGSDLRQAWRKFRYGVDLWRTTRAAPLVLTAHNLYPHNRSGERGVRSLIRWTYAAADVVIAHSAGARDLIQSEHRLPAKALRVIPHGSFDQVCGRPLPRDEARRKLGLDPQRDFVLMLGTIEPYKGLEGPIDFWRRHAPACDLRIVGASARPAYLEELRAAAAGHPSIHFTEGRQSDEEMLLWLSAANGLLLNYRAILTSGAAVLARSLGVPILIPARLSMVDLQETHPLVMRFDAFGTDFVPVLKRFLDLRTDFAAAEDYRRSTSWERIARLTARAYREALARKS